MLHKLNAKIKLPHNSFWISHLPPYKFKVIFKMYLYIQTKIHKGPKPNKHFLK